jgi:PAS domain S-box-containing protein
VDVRSRGSARLLEWVWRRRLPENSFVAHSFALLCVALAVVAYLVFETPGSRIAPYATLFPAVVIATLAGGGFAGLTALLASIAVAWLLLVPLAGTIVVSFASQVTSIVLFGATAFFLVGLSVLMRQAAEQLRAGKDQASGDHDRLLAALEASGAGTWRWDIQNDVVEWDEALCRLYGVPPDKAPRNLAEFSAIVHPDDRAFAGEVIRRCIEEGKTAEYEFRAVVPKGTLWIYDRSNLVRDAAGRPTYMMGACLDVTERRHAEEERGRMATWLRMAMEVAQIGTWEIEPKTGTLTASESMNAIFGIPADGKTRTAKDYMKLIHPEDVKRVEEVIARRAEMNEPLSVEYRLANPDGTVRWLASRGAYVRAGDGSARMVGALFDITDRKLVEEEREAALRQRELLLKELNHRVKNNLQMVSSLLNLQASRMTDPVAQEQFRKAMDRVQSVGDIHARLYQGEQLGRIDFDQYLNDLCDRLRDSMLDGKAITLKVDAEPLVLDLDRAIPLGLIVNELVTNAIKHAFPDGSRGDIRVELRTGNGDGLRLSIGDSGRGIQDGGGQDRQGLGMRLVQGLLQQVGGTIEVKHAPGVNYRISIPADGSAAAR